MIPCAPKYLRRQQHRYLKTFGSQIESKGSLKVEKLSYDFWFKTLRDSKVRVAKDHGKSSEVR